jgi:PPOX class probable F420-dependent enzyme
MGLAMSREERESFLADVHVGVFSVSDPQGAPLTVPIWYAYEPGGEVWIVTDRKSRKGKLLEEGTRVTLCAQTETVPYKYVTVQGSVRSIEAATVERDIRPLAHRYLGAELGDGYVQATEGDRERGESVIVRIRPERWLTVDYAKQFGSV